MKLTAITCTYQRPEAFELCQKYMARQTRQPDQWLILDGPEPMADKVAQAIEGGRVEGDAILFIEDDDFYFPRYIEQMEGLLQKYDLVGEGMAIYYNVRERWWSQCNNRSHASLCQTALTRNMFETLVEVIRAHKNPWFDSQLWKIECRKFIKIPKDGERLLIGIKGMAGKGGYSREHRQVNPEGTEPDEMMGKLRELIGDDADAYAKYYEPLSPFGDGVEEPRIGPLKIEVHILSHDHEQMLTFALRHYKTFATRIIVHDGGPTGLSTHIAHDYGVEAVRWDTSGKLNDELAQELKNTCWIGTDADWVICVDCDELIYFPEGATAALESYSRTGAAVIRPKGFEMFSNNFPEGLGQIYDEVKQGARDDKWYAKPVLFSPKKISESGFGVGAHDSRPVLKNGHRLYVGQRWPFPSPPCYLLHFHQIGRIERVAARYDATRKRLAEVNERKGYGNFKPGIVHAKEKRAYILPRLEQVVP